MTFGITTLTRRSVGVALALSLVGGFGAVAVAKKGIVKGALAGTQCLKGEVVSMSGKAVTVKYAKKGKVVTRAFSFSKKQFDAAVKRSVRRGSQIKLCFTKGTTKVKGNLLNLAPAGQEDTHGSGDNPTGGAGGGGGGGGGGT